MLAFSSRKTTKRGGGSVQQPLAYLDPTYLPPNSAAGSNLLQQNGLIVRPVIPLQTPHGMSVTKGGGSVQQPLAYLDPTETVPSATVGSNLLQQNGLIVRPAIPLQTPHGMSVTKGGFLPSVMKGVVNSGAIVAPLAAYAAKRMMNNTRKNKHGGGKKENWDHNREVAKEELLKYGNPSALNVNKYAALKRKNAEGAEDWLTQYIVKKRATKKVTKKTVKTKKAKATKKTVKTTTLWKNLLAQAKRNLEPYGKPSGANVAKFASQKKQGLNTAAFLANFQTRKKYVAPSHPVTAKNKYRNNLQQARQYLTQFGKPTVGNVSKFVSLKRKGQNTTGIETAVKSRVKPVILTGATVKSTTRSPPPANAKKYLQLLQKKLKPIKK
jgi:hypothetical protein